jgi:hypothetical protein
MTREKDRWNAQLVGVSWALNQVFVVQRLNRDWDRIVDLRLNLADAMELRDSLDRAINGITEQTADQVS